MVEMVITKKDLIEFLIDMDNQSTIDDYESYRIRNKIKKSVNTGLVDTFEERASATNDLADSILEKYGNYMKVEEL